MTIQCLLPLTRSRRSLPVLKNGTNLPHRHRRAGARIAADAGRAMLDREGAKIPELHPVAARQRLDDLFENDIDDTLDVAVIKILVGRGNFLNELDLIIARPPPTS